MIPSQESARYIWDIRSHPKVSISLFTKDASFDEFLTKFDLYYQLPDLPPLIIRQQEKRVGYITFRPIRSYNNPKAKAVEISIAIHPDFQGRGLAKDALIRLRKLRLNADEIWALIFPENHQSCRLFKQAGFEYYGQIDHQIWGLDTSSNRNVEAYYLSLRDYKPVFIIAEVGSNWRVGSLDQDIELVKRFAEGVKAAGCDAIKFQTFQAEKIYAKGAGKADYLRKGGIESSMEELFKRLAMPHEVIPHLAQICSDEGLEFMSTPFSEDDFDAVDPYVKRHKIGSYELCHTGLLKKAAESNKPLIISTGTSTLSEIIWAIDVLKRYGQKEITLLQCTSAYPAPIADMNIRAMQTLSSAFQLPIGLSDHSLDPFTAPLLAVAQGAKVIEKHVTLDRSMPGPDQKFAITLNELSELVLRIRESEEMIGDGVKEPEPSEFELFNFAKRRVQATRAIRKGESIKLGDAVSLLRPGKQTQGAHPSKLQEIEGNHAIRDIEQGHGVTLNDVER